MFIFLSVCVYVCGGIYWCIQCQMKCSRRNILVLYIQSLASYYHIIQSGFTLYYLLLPLHQLLLTLNTTYLSTDIPQIQNKPNQNAQNYL
ncbi:hypothetical protein BDQ94DRAFT_135786 [Aspergillus welwitschiae]|uniref:Uncharacterized protein n=1 Tax=Aspergillus welwitschiae TaxID=1341132 RepID=A0A3F3QFV6_9EURO|nr:hypothetical protein BDQ94DRAFT_135786 [Aspergillus welwitschiae]RDH38174.1 hypothetical protein BDQ94DRAFT_135786 [Aspergillus welwitschiae]